MRWLALAALPLLAHAADWQVREPQGLAERFRAPQGIRWGFFQNADGARIRYSHVPAGSPDARGVVVLMHGYSEFAEKYFELMRDLTARGYEVWQMDWRGYGGSDRFLADREKAHSLGVERDTRDLEQFVRTIVPRDPGRPRFLIAHSMGGHLAVRYLLRYPGRFRAAVLSSPFLSLSEEASGGLPEWVVRGVVWSANKTGFSESYAKGNGPWKDRVVDRLTHDPERARLQLEWTRSSPVLRIGGATNRWVAEYVRSFDAMARPGFLERLQTPVLLGSAQQDSLTRPEAHAAACARMRKCTLEKFPQAWHELFHESDEHRSRWMSAVFAFLDRHSAR